MVYYGTTKCNPLPKCDSDGELAESFASFFLDKIRKIQDNLDSHPSFVPDKRNIPGLTEFKPMSVPFTIFKKIAPHLKSKITTVVNLSLSHGVFAESWKNIHSETIVKEGWVGIDIQEL